MWTDLALAALVLLIWIEGAIVLVLARRLRALRARLVDEESKASDLGFALDRSRQISGCYRSCLLDLVEAQHPAAARDLRRAASDLETAELLSRIGGAR